MAMPTKLDGRVCLKIEAAAYKGHEQRQKYDSDHVGIHNFKKIFQGVHDIFLLIFYDCPLENSLIR